MDPAYVEFEFPVAFYASHVVSITSPSCISFEDGQEYQPTVSSSPCNGSRFGDQLCYTRVLEFGLSSGRPTFLLCVSSDVLTVP